MHTWGASPSRGWGDAHQAQLQGPRVAHRARQVLLGLLTSSNLQKLTRRSDKKFRGEAFLGPLLQPGLGWGGKEQMRGGGGGAPAG